jgi:hypothetical protein
MTFDAKLMCGIILLTVPSIQYGGYFLLTSLMDRGSGYMDNPLRQNFFRAGHAHAGVHSLGAGVSVARRRGHAPGVAAVACACGRAGRRDSLAGRFLRFCGCA